MNFLSFLNMVLIFMIYDSCKKKHTCATLETQVSLARIRVNFKTVFNKPREEV